MDYATVPSQSMEDRAQVRRDQIAYTAMEIIKTDPVHTSTLLREAAEAVLLAYLKSGG